MSSYILRRSRGDEELLALPVFTSRFFRHSCLFVNAESGIERPAFYRAFHAFRSAAILQGIIRRAMQGNNAGAMALSLTSENVRALAVRGLEYID